MVCHIAVLILSFIGTRAHTRRKTTTQFPDIPMLQKIYFILQSWGDSTDLSQVLVLYAVVVGSLCIYCCLGNELSQEVITIIVIIIIINIILIFNLDLQQVNAVRNHV
jgi:hypothetical protein